MAQKYIHGFEKKEQERLIEQADFLEPYVYQGVDLEFTQNLLEVGCGVGAQTRILCRRFPKLQIDGIDLSQAQLKTASKYLAKEIKSGRVNLSQQDAQKMLLKKSDYEASFICWFLEHVPNPLLVLKNVYKNLKPGAKVYVSEVFNHSLFIEPYSPAFLKYWFEFNDLQWEIKGHPNVGAQLGNLLKASGFKNINVEIRPFYFDAREPEKRTAFLDYFFDILLSAEEKLIEQKRVSPELIKQMKSEVETVKKSKNSVFYYSYVRATATK